MLIDKSNPRIKEKIISDKETLLAAMKLMDKVSTKLLIVFAQNKFCSLLSIGDIQRAIISGVSLDASISSIIRKEIEVIPVEHTLDDVKKIMLEWRAEYMPVIDSSNQLIGAYFWNDIFLEQKRFSGNFKLPVIVVAGGRGERLKPITNIIPKALVPISDQPIIDEIIASFEKSGAQNFYVILNYKAEMIMNHLSQRSNPRIEFATEATPLGTIGGLSLFRNKLTTPFVVTNCDILLDQDFSDVYQYHCDNKNDITIVSVIKNYDIPYGVLETSTGGELINITEKPTYNFQINSGVYIIEPHVLKHIEDNKSHCIVSLINTVKENDGKIGVFPISDGSWFDIGVWNEYRSTIDEWSRRDSQQ